MRYQHDAMAQTPNSSYDSSGQLQQAQQLANLQQQQQQQQSATTAADIETLSSFLSGSFNKEPFEICDEDVDMAMELLASMDPDKAALPAGDFQMKQHMADTLPQQGAQATIGQQQHGWIAEGSHPLQQLGAAAAASDVGTNLFDAFDAYLAKELQRNCAESSLTGPQKQHQIQQHGLACVTVAAIGDVSSACPKQSSSISAAIWRADASITAAPTPAPAPVINKPGSSTAAAAPQLQFMPEDLCSSRAVSCRSSNSDGIVAVEQQLQGPEVEALDGQLCRVLAGPLMAAAAAAHGASGHAANAGTSSVSIGVVGSPDSIGEKVAGTMTAGRRGVAAETAAGAAAAAPGMANAAAAAADCVAGCSVPLLIAQSSLTRMMTSPGSNLSSTVTYGSDHMADSKQQQQQQQQQQLSHSNIPCVLLSQPTGMMAQQQNENQPQQQQQQQQQCCVVQRSSSLPGTKAQQQNQNHHHHQQQQQQQQHQQHGLQRSRSLPGTQARHQPLKSSAPRNNATTRASRLSSRISRAIEMLRQQELEKQRQQQLQQLVLQLLLLQGNHSQQLVQQQQDLQRL